MTDHPAGQRHHTIDYVEIPVNDVGTARTFYATAFDWSFTDYGPDYAGIKDPLAVGREAGGLCRADVAPAGGGPLVIIFSADLDASVDRVVAAGGLVTAEPYAFPGGRRFHFTDPSGNELAVWSRA